MDAAEVGSGEDASVFFGINRAVAVKGVDRVELDVKTGEYVVYDAPGEYSCNDAVREALGADFRRGR